MKRLDPAFLLSVALHATMLAALILTLPEATLRRPDHSTRTILIDTHAFATKGNGHAKGEKIGAKS